MSGRRAWLIGYDITSPKRLRRIHRFLRARAFQVQYSLFVAAWTEVEFNTHWAGLARLIDPRRDDVRAWPLPENPQVDRIGQGLPEGVIAAMLRPRAVGKVLGASARSPATETAKVSSRRGGILANPPRKQLVNQGF